MRAYQITSDKGIDAIEKQDLPKPEVSNSRILIKVHATSLNYRDLGIAYGGYYRNDRLPVIALSDGAGEVVEVGDAVRKFKVGDKVAGCFFDDWPTGEISEPQMWTARGGGIDGMLAEYAAADENGVVAIPEHLSYEEAATLPCAAVTAWQALVVKGGLNAGDTILTLGTGGVSVFALQIARAAGARVIITSSSDEKLERAKELGADGTINYKSNPDWEKEVRNLTNGRGVDNVVEVGGPATLEKSIASARLNGHVSLIGVLGGAGGKASPIMAFMNRLTIHGIYVGSRDMFEDLNRSLEANQVRPVIDKVFEFDQALDAYRYLKDAKHFGKVVIKVA